MVKFFEILTFTKKYLGLSIILIVILTIITGLLEGIGLALLAPILDESSSNGIKKYFIGYSSSELILVVGIIFFLKGIFTFLATGYSSVLRSRLNQLIRHELVAKLSLMSNQKFKELDKGEITNTLTEQVSRVLLSFNYAVQAVSFFLTGFIFISFAFFVDIVFGIFSVLVGLSIFLFFRYINRIAIGYSNDIVDANSSYTQNLMDLIENGKYLKSTNKSSYVTLKIEVMIKKISNLVKKAGILSSFTGSIREPLVIVFIAILIFIQVNYFGKSLISLVTVVLLFYRAFNSLMAFQSRLQNALDYSGSIKNIKALLNSLDTNMAKENFYNNKSKKIETDAQIKLVNISKSFQQKIIFKNYSLTIMRNRAYAIVGKSGSGKSTLIDLLLGITDPDKGKVTFNLTPDEVGYVCQNPTVFNASIIENITLGGDFKFDEIEYYIDKFELRDDIENLPNGFNTIIGKAGESLSGGQIQRLSIIRELIKKPKLIVLDEYTSALDSRMEKIIHDYLLSLKDKMTIIVITHRDYPQNGANEIITL